MPHKIIFFFIICCIIVSISAAVTAQPPPPEAIMTVTDSAAPADDSQIPFRSVTVGEISNRIITIFNAGDASLVIENIDGLAAPFRIVNDNCSKQSIDPSNSCTLSVRFSPTAEGAITDAFAIPSNDSDESLQTISVSGTGLAASSNNPPSAPRQISPSDNQTGLGSTVEFSWEKSTDSDGEAVTYDLYICTDDNFTLGCISGGENIAFSGLNKSVYYAGMGGYGASLLLSGLAAAYVGGRVRRRNLPLLVAVTGIMVLIFASCGGGGGGGSADTTPSDNTDPINEATYTSSGLSEATTYYWKIVARDAMGEETSSRVLNFSTQ
ncbi:MAG: choice-of-anchor D domain-containing protein [Nitrospirae bacterium]|nr:choice-of-anchor D domain-containing protein [Nitrospirota bacterium]